MLARVFLVLHAVISTIYFLPTPAYSWDITDEPFIGFDVAPMFPPESVPIVVTAVHPGSQAEAAGLKAGDVITSILLITDNKNNIPQPSHPEAGVAPNFLNPTIEDL